MSLDWDGHEHSLHSGLLHCRLYFWTAVPTSISSHTLDLFTWPAGSISTVVSSCSAVWVRFHCVQGLGILELRDLSCSFAVLPLLWDQDWSSCLVEPLIWFPPFVLGPWLGFTPWCWECLHLVHQVWSSGLRRRPKARLPKGTDPRNSRSRLNERSGGPKFSVR